MEREHRGWILTLSRANDPNRRFRFPKERIAVILALQIGASVRGGDAG